MTRIVFLGTAGGRFATILQTRRTGGIVLQDGVQVHIDPGPGAIRAAWRYGIDPQATDVLVVTHSHTEHYGDAEIAIEAMTGGGRTKRGTLLASRSALQGEGGIGPAISSYHRGLPDRTVPLAPGGSFVAGHLAIEATPTRHSDPTGIGLRAGTSHGTVAFSSDTALSPEVMDALCGARVLVLNVTVESELTNAMHLTPASARIIVERVRPEIAVLTHFSQWLLESGPGAIASWLERETGSWVVAADDGLVVDVGRTISLASDSRPARLSEIESASAGRRCNGLGGPGSASDPPSAGPKDIT